MFNERVKSLSPYTVSERDKFIHDKDWLLLDWNESTKPLSVSIQNKLIELLKHGLLNYYPDTHCIEVLSTLSNYLKIPINQISIFNGSDSALNISFECILNEKDKVSIYGPEYSQVDTFIKMKGASINLIPVEKIFESDFDFDYVDKSIKNSKIFYLSNPNNPTGKLVEVNILEKLISNNPNTFFFIDEAYHDFAKDNCSRLINKFENLIIFRTFSKAFGLAGLRIGYILSTNYNITLINKVRNGKEVNSIAQKAVCEILKNDTDYISHINEIISTRKWFTNEINLIPGFISIPSQSNFILIKHEKFHEILNYLFQNKILVRDRSNLIGLEKCFRITIGTNDEMKRVLNTIIKWNETNYTRS